MLISLLTIILVTVFFILMTIMFSYDKFTDTYKSITITVGIIAFITFIFAMIEKTNPTAIDVYRGRTTLEITYKDGVPIDTVVVFKKKR